MIMNKIKTALLTLIMILGLALGTNAAPSTPVKAPVKQNVTATNTVANTQYTEVKALDVVASPSKYLNKKIKIKAKFDKFSVLGLDYKPAFRSSEKYISFLIKRDDVTNHTVPLSEMKIFMKREMAEKHIDLNSGDIVEFNGYVFSTALSDPWVEVETFTVLTPVKKDTNSTKK